ncbi:MAG: glycerol-3-phosphate acyltransferase [candidate division WOR-3 bacterium]
MINAIIWAGLGFLLGSIPFSVILGRLFLSKDIRDYGDRNPGAANIWRAGGGTALGLLAVLLDLSKGFAPVFLARFWIGVSGVALVLVALAPVLGHAFSPFLCFKGGKAIASTFGIWGGFALLEGPLALGVSMGLIHFWQKNNAWTVIIGFLVFLAYLLLRHSDPFTLTIWAGNMAVVTWKHLPELREPLRVRPVIIKAMRRMFGGHHG